MRITCPECETVLRPAKPLAPGKKVKCPKCGNIFEAVDSDADGSSEPAPAAAVKKKLAGSAKPEKKPEKKPAPGTDEDDEGGTYGLAGGTDAEKDEDEEDKPDITYAPDTSIKDLRGPAQSAVIQPTNLLIGAGVGGFLGYLTLLIILTIPFLFPIETDEGTKDRPKSILKIDRGLGKAGMEVFAGAPEKPKDPNDKGNVSFYQFQGTDFAMVAMYEWYMFIFMMMPLVLGMAYTSVQTYGIVRAQNLESRSWGIASSIMAMIPFSLLGLAGVICMFASFMLNMFMDDLEMVDWTVYGIAAVLGLAQIAAAVYILMVLMRPEVIEGFEFVPDMEDVKPKKKDKARRRKQE